MRDKIRDFWNKLGQRDRLVLSAGAALALIIFVVQFALVPYADARKKLSKSIQAQEKTLKEMAALGAEYQVLQRGMETVRNGMARRSPDFTLFSHLEKKATQSGVRSNLKNMQPARAPVSGGYDEASVEIKLEKITLKQLVNFLYSVESPQDLVRVKRLSVRKSSEDPQYLSAVIQVATFEKSRGENMPARRS